MVLTRKAEARRANWFIGVSGVVCIALRLADLLTFDQAVSVWIVVIGLFTASYARPFRSQPRWPYVTAGLALAVAGVGGLLGSFATMGLSLVVAIPCIVLFAPRTDIYALELSEDIRAEHGFDGGTDEHGALLGAVLVDVGPKSGRVLRRLSELFYPIGRDNAWLIASQLPFVLRITTSRREVEFIIAQLAEVGARVEIRECGPDGYVGEDEDEAPFDVVLTHAGPRPAEVVDCLRDMYPELAPSVVEDMARQSMVVLQTVPTRQEALPIAARLIKCGAQVEIWESMGNMEGAHRWSMVRGKWRLRP